MPADRLFRGPAALALLAFGLQPMAASGEPPATPAPVIETKAVVRGSDGRDRGEIRVQAVSSGLLVHVALHDLPPGAHGFHVHKVGLCEPPFESAGDHLALRGGAHGFLDPKGPHEGDLVNLQVGKDGRTEQELLAPDLRIADLLDSDGAAFVVHAKPDDHSTQPSGASGDRIACGVVHGSASAR